MRGLVAIPFGLVGLLVILAVVQDSAAHATCLPPPPGLIAWWRGDGSPYDQVANHHAIPSAGLAYAPAMVDSGFSLAGTSAFLTVPADTSLDLSDGKTLSFAAWVKVAVGSPATQFILDKRASSTGPCPARGYAIYLSSGRIVVQLDGPADCVDRASTSPDQRDGAFHFVAVTIDRNIALGGKVYVDGVQTFNFDCSTTAGDLTNGSPLTIGHYGFGGPDFNFQGVLDEVDLYRRVLTATEIGQIYAAGASGKCLPPFFFAEDLNWTSAQGVDNPVRPDSLPNSRRVQAQFGSNLKSSAVSVGFEGIATGPITQFSAGSRTVSVTGVTGTVEVREQDAGTSFGAYPTEGNRFLFQFNNPSFTLNFDSAIVAFGFMGTDIGDGGASLLLTFQRADGTTQNILVPNSRTAPGSWPNISGSALFFGIIDRDHPFTSITFTNPNNPLDGFGFDEMMIAGIENLGVSEAAGGLAPEVRVVPNPSRGGVRFELPDRGMADVRIYDVSGRVVWSATSYGPELRWDGRGRDGQRRPVGPYWIRVSSAAGTRTREFVLLR
jgi:hypothetical protein